MSREEYISELRARIAHLPREEQEAAMSYYIEYLQEASDKTMEEIIAELGTPRDVAERIIADYSQSETYRQNNSGAKGCLFGILLVLTSPVWLTILLTVLILVLVFGVLAITFLVLSAWLLFIYPATALVVAGAALMMAALTLLCIVLLGAAGKGVKKLASAFRAYDRG